MRFHVELVFYTRVIVHSRLPGGVRSGGLTIVLLVADLADLQLTNILHIPKPPFFWGNFSTQNYIPHNERSLVKPHNFPFHGGFAHKGGLDWIVKMRATFNLVASRLHYCLWNGPMKQNPMLLASALLLYDVNTQLHSWHGSEVGTEESAVEIEDMFF